ncbi:hypothetical protein MUP65_02580 [Patescibacteria group bacterium]|nr:hypothetical protein [Patescibacteria group bacterium]
MILKQSPITQWREAKKQRLLLGRKGKLVSCTLVVSPPAGFGDQSYWVGVAQFRNGEKMTAPLVVEGVEPVAGRRVEAVWRRLGEVGPEEYLVYGIKLKVVG